MEKSLKEGKTSKEEIVADFAAHAEKAKFPSDKRKELYDQLTESPAASQEIFVEIAGESLHALREKLKMPANRKQM